MARLTYSCLMSLDGYIADTDGNFDWAVPDEEVHAAVNDITPTGTLFLGRRMYDVVVAWETWDVSDEPAVAQDFSALWHGTDKVVYSRTLAEPRSARTRIAREFDADEVRRLKQTAVSDLGVGGADLAGQFAAAGLIDDIHLFISPVIVGGGTRFLPGGVKLDLELVTQRRFGNGVMHLHYRNAT
ncbi:MAG TPA: dihydrofolate reductase family protein [Pseudolysinimonas sp.]|nr:dihydrofolate reductase family protein [Pseudolysinimonas sp.]